MEHKNRIVATLAAAAQANIERHMMNVEVVLNNPVGVGEHAGGMETIKVRLT